MAAYGLGDAGFLIVWQGAALFLLFFYVEIAGLPPLLAGAIFIAGMVWDALSDPLFAAYAERRVARGGSYAGLVRLAAPLLGLSYLLLFCAPQGPMWVVAMWAGVSHLVFRSVYTLASMPYNALPARLTLVSDERSGFTAARVVAAAAGGLTAASATPVLVTAFGDGRAGYALMAAALGGVAAGILMISGLCVREAAAAPAPARPDLRARPALAELWAVARGAGPLQRLLAIMVTATLGFAIFTGAIVFQVESRNDLAAIAGLALAAPSLASLIAAPVWPLAAAATSKRTALLAGALVAGAGFAAFGLADGVASALAALVLTGAGLAAIPVMLWSMAADAVDHGHAATGVRVEARVFGLFTLLQKTATGVAALVITAGLAAAGAEGDAGGLVARNWALIALTSILPAVFMAVTALIAAGYKLDREAHAAIMRTLQDQTARPAR